MINCPQPPRSDVPFDPEQARQRLVDTPIPAPVLAVAGKLHDAGHAAVLVGGAVRDALRGRPQDDWDLASSATPKEVQAIFRRTIPTGVQHGTVTVLSGHGDARVPVEVTTFRGEGAYVDGRRPSEVHFLRDLEKDLARRDFTINAMAWDTNTQVLTDIYGGLDDLRAGLIRAVGTPRARFREDGLRTMRAVRFSAVLGYALHSETAGAIPEALDVLARVSGERVRVELLKLLKGEYVSFGLNAMVETKLWDQVLIPVADQASRSATIDLCAALPRDGILRLARVLWPHRGDLRTVRAKVESLKPSGQEKSRLLRLLAGAGDRLAAADSGIEIRRAASALGRATLEDWMTLTGCDESRRSALSLALDGAPLSIKELALQGRDLITEGVMQPGPQMGVLLDRLLETVHAAPHRNERAWLLETAREMIAAESSSIDGA